VEEYLRRLKAKTNVKLSSRNTSFDYDEDDDDDLV
jgi:hypothetical protein